jgi:hypothetical protein
VIRTCVFGSAMASIAGPGWIRDRAPKMAFMTPVMASSSVCILASDVLTVSRTSVMGCLQGLAQGLIARSHHGLAAWENSMQTRNHVPKILD